MPVPRLPILPLLLALAFAGLAGESSAQADAPRVALLIGNPLRVDESGGASNASSFQAIGDRLAKLGFSVRRVEGTTKAGMNEAVREFAANAKPGSAALFLFRGVMLRIGQRNFLMPADARGASEPDAGIELNAIESDLSERGAGIKIIVIDATETEPGAQRQGSGRPAALELHEGTLAIINAGPDRRVGAPAGDDDVFLSELLKQTTVPGVTVEQAFAKTRVAVARATSGRQIPSVSSSLLNDFYLAQDVPPQTEQPKSQAAQAPVAPPAAKSAPEAAGPPSPGEIFRDCETCPELVVVPSGEFTMGSTDTEAEKPSHRVTIAKPFAIGRHEVTFAQWDACVAAKACKADIDDHGFGRAQQPVIDVSWDEAQAFIKWLSGTSKQRYRLPSEAEWEYAARAGSRSAFPWGATAGVAKANCSDCSPTPLLATQPVGSFRPNAFGLFDTTGNAAEWVDDCWNGTYRGAPGDGSSWQSGQCQLRVLRGGSFGNKASAGRSSARFRYDRDVRYYTNGFRVARDLQ